MEKLPDTDRLPLIVDSRELARTGRALEGSFQVRDLERLASLLSRSDGRLDWRARGERQERADGGHDELLHLRIEGRVAMQCVRCLGETPVTIRVDRGFRLVGDEAQATREDAEDAEFDVLAGGARFDLGGLIEDEAIMALPSIARHDECALPLSDSRAADMTGSDDEEERIRPFAGLAALKGGRH